MKRSILISMLALMLSACGGAQPWDRAFWFGHTRLERLNATSWSPQIVEGSKFNQAASLNFAGDGNVSGSAGCNRYFGTVKVSGSSIRFGDMGVTKMMCAGDVMTGETEFFEALNNTRSYSIGVGGKLHLMDEKGAELAQFAPVKAVK